MSIRRSVIALLALGAVSLTAAAPDAEKRVEELLARMTLEEKLGQMSQGSAFSVPLSNEIKDQIRKGRWGSFLNAGGPDGRVEAQRIALKESRLGVPILFGRDVIHGYKTVFPIPLGQSASWDPELIEAAARVAAREASAEGYHWTFAPMIDITRDPRWGRVAETLGEDPYLTSVLGAAMVRGFQGERLDAAGSLAACAKHYVGYGAAEAGRDYNSTWIPENRLREVYLPPFHAARQAGVATFMSAFNALNGVPASANPFTLRQVLREEWKYDGMVVSDWTSIEELIAHGVARDGADAARQAALAGVDMEMVSTNYFDRLPALVKSGQVPMSVIDQAVRNILRLKFRLGLFDKAPEAAGIDPAAESLALARRAAVKSVALLKNDGVLPLAKNAGRVAVIGPLADAPEDQMGTWTLDGRVKDVETPLAALRKALGEQRVAYAPGLKNSRDESREGFAAAVEAARGADVALLFLGEERSLSGEARSRAFLDLPGAQEALVEELAKTGKPMAAVILAGRPLTFHAVAARVNAVMYAWHPGTMGGPAICDLLLGDASPSGKLTITFPRTVGQVPIYYARLNTGRPAPPGERGVPMGSPLEPKDYTSKYIDVDLTPEYPFGFGLSYTTFEYSNLRVSQPRLPLGGKLSVSAEIANTGQRDGEEIVQLYVRDVVASVARPLRELKGFQRVRLRAGEKRTVTFQLTTGDLAFYNAANRLATEPGRFQVWIAPDSTRGVQGEFTVE